MHDISVRQLRAFLTVAEMGSFTRAAEKLHVSQPALTVQIRSLEDTLGERVLDRNSRGVRTTRFGLALLPSLQRMLAQMESVLHDARELGAGTQGTVRIAALPSFASSLLPELIRRTHRATPEVRFIVHDAVASTVNAMVRDGTVDIGVTGGRLSDAEVGGVLDVVQKGQDRLCLVYPKGHPVSGVAKLTIKDILPLPMVLTAAGTSVRAVVDAAFARSGHQPLLACEPMYMMTAVAMVSAGLGVTILPRSAREILCEPGLQVRVIDDRSFMRPVALITRHGHTLAPAARAFLDLCGPALMAFCDGEQRPRRRAAR